jgi:XRE family transcriptional regulator, regulator of sulfur utilization
MELGKTIGLLIKKKGFTQKEVAKLIGKSPTAISLIIKGEYNPNPETLEKLCEVLEVPRAILYFLSITEDEIPNDKIHLYRILAPSIREFILEIFGKEQKKLLDSFSLS